MAGFVPARARFSIGALFLVPPADTDGGADPKRIGNLKDVKLSPSFGVAKLQGENLYAEDAAIKDAALEIDIKFTKIDSGLYLAAIPGAVKTTGAELLTTNEAASIPATPYQITVAGAANFGTDLGVYDVQAGTSLDCVTGTPTTGQYSVTVAGVYTFAAADTGHAVKISYSTTAATGETITLNQQMAEANAVFYAIKAFNKTNGKTEALTLNKVLIHGLELGWKLQEWAEYGLKGTVLPDANGVIGAFKVSA